LKASDESRRLLPENSLMVMIYGDRKRRDFNANAKKDKCVAFFVQLANV
jgi:hypothetical protein